ncbi:MAG: T9SS type A sorting domain-containing protein [Chitinophagaceae bacterium]|nr:T9SS type A sorting domain-containing protein [Chitinophagaceae bacterium]
MRKRLYSGYAITLLAGFFLLSSLKLNAQNNGPQWPTLTEQLTNAKVKPGSAFETLIKANQDFSQLREDEKTDKRNLPPWLRMFWRKAHPEGNYVADDPTGGYPLVLKEMLEWMMTHQDLQPGPGGELADGGGAPANLTISNEARVSGAQTVARSESDIRINFFDPTKIISASNNIGGTGRQGVYYSTNGGSSWAQTELPLTSGDSFQSDPTVDWTSDSKAWSSTLGINSAGTVLKMRNYVSSDNGATWTLDATVSGSQTAVDKQMVWVDHSSTSPYFNQQYAIWHNNNPAYMNRRTAGVAGTWLAAPIQVNGAESTGTCIGSDVKTNSFGDVFGFWPTTGNRKILVTKSTNGGASYGTPVQITTTYDSYDIGVPAFNSRRILIYVSGGAYRTASKNMVYACWTDLSGDVGCTAAANEPGSNVASTCKTRIWFARSLDGGATWQTPIKINPLAGLNDQFNQWMAVDETNGVIGIMYYDTQADPGRKKTDVYFQYSTNDGVAWSAAQKVTTGQTDETAAGADAGNQYGDYNGMSYYDNNAWPVWTDRRNNGKEEIWTAKIANSVVPIKLIQFNAYLQDLSTAMISWKIAQPEDGTTFELERSSNGNFFNPINTQRASASSVQFNYTDAGLAAGTYYYRLKITGLPGDVAYSNIAIIKVGSKEERIFVYPNPVTSSANASVQVSVTYAELQSYTLTDMQGRKIAEKNNLHITGSMSIFLPVQIPGGTYFLRLQTNKGMHTEKIIVY